jgi:mutator protein MutT
VRPVVAALAVTVREDCVLLVRRRNPPDAGLWGFAGGKVEPGETVAEAALRELQEETGVAAEALEAYGPLDIIGHDGAGGLAHHFVLIPVLCRWLAGTPQAAEDALEARWFALEALDPANLPMSKDVAELARHGVRRLGENG